MITRGKSEIFKPKVLLVNYIQHEPCSKKEALRHHYLKKATEDEFNALHLNNTWIY